ncbi:hypothetical protein GIS00_14185 [Nakamurella sp. YIM 132087]|uniref:Uncharacterized protein n=1 Tax=Nakamurella alba TaxID=2665158 RepID=A0A7K1FLV4_9ACTN|nr:hypothetical protein [Nakamurella alba]MTD15088.1 hypothetical protein [Nakamurella alba]
MNPELLQHMSTEVAADAAARPRLQAELSEILTPADRIELEAALRALPAQRTEQLRDLLYR